MEVQEVEITIDKDGKVNIHVRGLQGAACLDITQALEAVLGNEIESREMTPEAGDSRQNPLGNNLQIKR